MLNVVPTSTFNATRGIRQGDPISPFFFILAAEGLGRYFKKELRERKIKGLRLWGNNFPITHQQFVDDIMLFCEVSINEVRGVKRILELFMEALGMEINKEKSCTFIFNTPEKIKAHLSRMLGFRHGELPTKYLWNQLDINPRRIENWQQVIKKLKNRLASWCFRSLNIAGRLVSLKLVLQSITIYPLSIMAVPKGVRTKMKGIFGKIIWGGPKQQRKWALVSWKNLTKRKEEGGLGLRDPDILNKFLGAKLWWRWMRGGNDLWKRIWTQKYNMPATTTGILILEETPKGSTIWELASESRNIINNYAFWEIRGGYTAIFWEEEWQQRDKMVSIQALQSIHQKVVREGLEYKGIFIKELESRKIKARLELDILRWRKSTRGAFTVKESYYLTTHQEREGETLDWEIIWNSKWWLKIAIFAWLVRKERILTWDKIQKRGFLGPPRCSLCKQGIETQEHILNSCPFTQHQWEEIRGLFGKSNRDPRDIKKTIFQWGKGQLSCKVVRRTWNLAIGFVIWLLWKERNRRIFLDKANTPEKIWRGIQNSIRETVLAETWEEEDWKANPEEGRILAKLNMEFDMMYPRKEKQQRSQT
eukprot:PITA_19943